MSVFKSGYILAGNEVDTGLFTGNAGIGYAYLCLRKSNSAPDILAPWVTRIDKKRSFSKITVHNIITTILTKTMPKSFATVGKRRLGMFGNRLVACGNRISTPGVAKLFIESGLCKTPTVAAELADMELRNNISSFSFLQIKKLAIKKINKHFLKSADDDEIFSQNFRLIAECKLFYNGSVSTSQLSILMSQENVLDIMLNDFCYVILRDFDGGKTTVSILKRLKNKYCASTKKEMDHLMRIFVSQIREFLVCGIIYPTHLINETFEKRVLLTDQKQTVFQKYK